MDNPNKRVPKNALDLKNKKFGKLTALERCGRTKNGSALWHCKCECGNTFKANATSLRRGETISCGCARQSQAENARNKLWINKSIEGIHVPLLTKKVRSDSETGHKGVSKRIRRGKVRYEAYISVNGKRKYLGSSTDINDAIKLRKDAELKYYDPYIKKLEGKENGQDDNR
ncbi:hypothetical protein HXA31_20025 [Salipaludibacillus agaradhaerens]|jgi:hypothetical protein|uniref:hypothetical protein n=1 Tax=Salipaludibacillus TaxID=1884449 RepID=UPI000995DF5A|nr:MULTISPECIES: hypothetical protein [Salipaludibacillus]MCR6116619.1 hypothetical protein [Salipaludibacillus agaradhaerens]UTR13503.1 hypothetical protein MM221_12785 [Salipaludibacillus sp. LMS25]